MIKDELQNMIAKLQVLVDESDGYINNHTILEATGKDFMRCALEQLASNNIGFTLAVIAEDTRYLAHRILELEDSDLNEEAYLDEVLQHLDNFKLEVQNIKEYVCLKRQIAELDNESDKRCVAMRGGVKSWQYQCVLNNIRD